MNLELIPHATSQDLSGFGVFSHGDAGDVHVMAHRMLDEERYELGHRLLGPWLEQHEGNGSCWTHLQWHMGVFEIAVGRWKAALRRFETEILPVAAASFDALTDAPAMLWRLQLAAPRPVALDWEAVRKTAVRRLTEPCDAYVELHCVLALAGGGDVDGLDCWLRARRSTEGLKTSILTEMGAGLRAVAAEDYELGAALLTATGPKVSLLGGSHAQNQLFQQIADHCWTRVQTMTQAA
jgi:hypothetical protein